MKNKLSLIKFKIIKRKLLDLKKQFEIDSNALDDVFQLTYDHHILETNFLEDYFAIQNELLSYDLSAIPAKEWHDLEIMYNDSLDFSKTKANLDFSIVRYFNNANYQNCNIINLDQKDDYFYPSNFSIDTINKYPNLFLSEIFSRDFKEKFYERKLSLNDLIDLSDEQLSALNKMKFIKKYIIVDYYTSLLIKNLGIMKTVQLYKYYKDDFKTICDLFNMNLYSNDSFLEDIQNTSPENIKDLCYTYTFNNIFNQEYHIFDLNKLPQKFIDNYPEYFLTNKNITPELRSKFYIRKLSLKDVIENLDLFNNIIIDNFIDLESTAKEITNKLGFGNLQKLLTKYFGFFKYLVDNKLLRRFERRLSNKYDDYEKNFILGAKDFLEILYNFRIEKIPDWASSLNLKIVHYYNTWNELITYNDNVILTDNEEKHIIDFLGINNIIKLEEETHIFTHKDYKNSDTLEFLENLMEYYNDYSSTLLDINADIANLDYDSFCNYFAKLLNEMRINQYFYDYEENYGWITGSFREKYPEIFIDPTAPEKLIDYFYSGSLTIKTFKEHPEYIPYIIDKDLNNIITDFKSKIYFKNKLVSDKKGINFIDFYSEKFGNKACLDMLIRYEKWWEILDIIVTEDSFDKNQIDKDIRNELYHSLIKSDNRHNWRSLADDKEFTTEYPDIFIDLTNVDINIITKTQFEDAFYRHHVDFECIRLYPQLIDVLKDKNLYCAFDTKYVFEEFRFLDSNKDLISIIGNVNFLNLCAKYGKYFNYIDMESIVKYLPLDKDSCKKIPRNFEDMDKVIKTVIYENCLNGIIKYLPTDAPEFLKVEHPEIFLDDNAPEDLKDCFYNKLSFFSFYKIQENKEWIPYLKNKNIVPALLKSIETRHKEEMKKYFNIFGNELALKLGTQKPQSVIRMIFNHKVQEMYTWYEKSGHKFIPDYVVMLNFPIDEADKFFSSFNYWNKLMQIKRYNDDEEAKEALLKLAYVFGVFHNDTAGFQKLYKLICDIPHHLNNDIFDIEEFINYEKNDFQDFDGLEYDPNIKGDLINIRLCLQKEGFKVSDYSPIFEQIYRKNNDNSYTLTFNPQSYPKSTSLIRKFLENYIDNTNFLVVYPSFIHLTFGSFDYIYDKDFKRFFIENFDTICSSQRYSYYISNIQHQFADIKLANSNRVLTLDLAVSFVQQNEYEKIDIGNNYMAEISSIAGYSQNDFNTLQQIYNYGKARTFSSIPRIENKTNKYNYEILRLDDPLALTIGTLTDCCQALHNMAEVCMEHSMISQNGRIFVIYDKEGNIVSQSWVWRNKNVLCFDNIEIPRKAFARINIRKATFAQEIYDIYKQAAKELMEEDEKIYKKLLEDDKITEEQYNGLRLSKITVGLGYNDIADAIKKNSDIDSEILMRPLPYTSKFFNRNLYISDSKTQYVLEKSELKDVYDGNDLTIHNDTYPIYDSSNITNIELTLLKDLEKATKENYNSKLYGINYNDISLIANLYNLEKEKIKIVIHPNFAIIYCEEDDYIKIADIFYNNKISLPNEEKSIFKSVVIQIHLALKQISKNKNIDNTILNTTSLEIFEKAMNLTTEIDIEKGLIVERR